MKSPMSSLPLPAMKFLTEASGLYVDGVFYGAVEDAAPIRALLDSMLDQYRTGSENERVDFVQDVELSKGLYLLSSLVEPGGNGSGF